MFDSCQVELGIPKVFIGDEGLEWVRERCANGWFWVIEVDARIAGAMLLVPPGQGFVIGNAMDEVVYVLVRPDFRGLRIGPTLLAHAQTLKPALVAQSKDSNTKSLSMLKRAGFVATGPAGKGSFIDHEWRGRG